MTSCLIFSFDRAMQLDAVLRSFFLHCHEADQTPISVLYRTSNKKHALQYEQLISEYASQENIYFIREENFRKDVLSTLNSFIPQSRLYNFINLLIKWGGKVPHFVAKMIFNGLPDIQILFLVDDNLFVRDFSLKLISNLLKENTDALGFSLRLGKNTTYCYSLEVQQAIPKFTSLSENISIFDWTKGDSDFSYPLEISSSVYRLGNMFPLILSILFENPNLLEGRLAQKRSLFRIRYPKLLCFEESIAFCNPVNKIQEVNNNFFGINYNYSCEELAQQFDEGYRINVNAYSGFVPNACHQEVELKFKKYDN